MVGYTGGHFKDPKYEDVCSGRTGHAEAVQVTYDSDRVSLEQILNIFWKMNAPNYPSYIPDGQYRSAVFFFTPDQQVVAQTELAKLEKSTKRKIFTEITHATEFYKAEEYHQNYNRKNGFEACGISDDRGANK